MHVYPTRFAGIHGVQNHRASILQSSPVQSILGPPDCSFRPSCAGPAVSNLAWSRMPTYCLCKPSKCLDRCWTRYEGSILCSDYLLVFVLSIATVSGLSTSRKDSCGCAVVLLQHDSWTVRLSPQTFTYDRPHRLSFCPLVIFPLPLGLFYRRARQELVIVSPDWVCHVHTMNWGSWTPEDSPIAERPGPLTSVLCARNSPSILAISLCKITQEGTCE